MTYQTPLILAIGGGKGGVGKSMVSANMGVQFAQAGAKTVVVDLDFGAANLHTLFGVRQPDRGLIQFLKSPRREISEFLVQTGVDKLSLLPCCGYLPELANLKHAAKARILRQLRNINADLILLDLGAGSSYHVVDFFTIADAGLIVTTPEPTAVVNAYEFLKNVIHRLLSRMFRGYPLILDRLKAGYSSIPELIESISSTDPWAARTMSQVCADRRFYLLLNQARQASQVQIGAKLHRVCKRYLNLPLHFSGMVYYNEQVHGSVLKMGPISLTHPQSTTAQGLERAAYEILNDISSDRSARFEEQLERVMRRAQGEFRENHLAQKKLMRKRHSKIKQ